MDHTTTELVWARCLLIDFDLFISIPTFLHCDSKVPSILQKNEVFHEHKKHIEVDCHFACYQFRFGTLSLTFVSTVPQIAVFFTESHTSDQFLQLSPNSRSILSIASL